MYAQSPALQLASMRLLSHLFKLYKAPVDLSDLEAELAKNPEKFAAPAGGDGAPAPGGEGTGTSMNDILQGLSNVGGGRV